MNLIKLKEQIDNINKQDLDKLKSAVLNADQIIILGNGGSNAISCHIAEDYTKALGKKTISFGDSARMSCYANDYGWENAYQKFIEHFADVSNTLIILMSSSGNSKNIINCAKYCKDRFKFIIMTGFDLKNSLRSEFSNEAFLDFWIDSNDYGIIECSHEIILHSII